MRRTARVALSCVSLLGIMLPGMAFAPPPAVQASLSRNGRFMIIADPVYVNASASPMRMRSTTFRILSSLRSNPDQGWAPNNQTSFWSNTMTLAPAAGDDARGRWPLISENGQYVALVRVGDWQDGGTILLSVYRMWPTVSHIAVYKVADLMTQEERTADHPPRSYEHSWWWLKGGELAFSEDSSELICRHRSGRTVQIQLSDGRIVGRAK
ncbi:hypothetical protein [Acidipila sp. EB88]|uniref:hypothetical protein n=1 Tax=Acidipila sp. EB88 TaxID=2305226 RepID=UPI000F5DA24C|nr:hypothetical protein [Acidipila sp. EB88]